MRLRDRQHCVSQPVNTLKAAAAAMALLIPVASAGHAQTQGREPAAVAKVRAKFTADCKAAGYTGLIKPGFLSRADFNGDGARDYLLDTSKLDCGSYYCGTAGCVIVIVMSGADGQRESYAEGFRDNVREWSLQRTGNRHILKAGMHGSQCRRAGNDACHVSFTWRVDGFVKAR